MSAPLPPRTLPRPLRAYAHANDYCKKQNVRRVELARALGISRAHMTNILSGKRGASGWLALKIAELTNSPLEPLLKQHVPDPRNGNT